MDRQHRVGWSRKRFARLPQMIKNLNVSIQTSEEMDKVHHPCVFHSVAGIIDVDNNHGIDECSSVCNQKDIPEWALHSMPWLNRERGTSSFVSGEGGYKAFGQYTPMKKPETLSMSASPGVGGNNNNTVTASYCKPTALPGNIACSLPFGPEGLVRPMVSPLQCMDNYVRRRQFLSSLDKMEKLRGVVTRIDWRGLHVLQAQVQKINNSSEVARNNFGCLSSQSLPCNSEIAVEMNVAPLNMICLCPYTELPPTWQAQQYEALPQQFHPLEYGVPCPSPEVCEQAARSLVCLGDVLDFTGSGDFLSDNFQRANLPRKTGEEESLLLTRANCCVTLRLVDEADVVVHRETPLRTDLLDLYRNQPSQQLSQPPPECVLALMGGGGVSTKQALDNSTKYDISNTSQDSFVQRVNRLLCTTNPRNLELSIACYNIAQYGSFLPGNVVLRRRETLEHLQAAQTHSWCIHGQQKGLDFYNRHLYEQAIKCFTHALHIQEQPDAVCLLAQCHIALKQAQVAAEFLKDKIDTCKAGHVLKSTVLVNDDECGSCHRYVQQLNSISGSTPVDPCVSATTAVSSAATTITAVATKRKYSDLPADTSTVGTPLEQQQKKGRQEELQEELLDEERLVIGGIPTSQPAMMGTPSPAPLTTFVQPQELPPLPDQSSLPQLREGLVPLDWSDSKILLQHSAFLPPNPTVQLDSAQYDDDNNLQQEEDYEEDEDSFEHALIQLEENDILMPTEGDDDEEAVDAWGQSPFTSPVSCFADHTLKFDEE